MAEDADYNPGDWAGHDFKSARAFYDDHAGRSYKDASAKGTTAASLVSDKLTTQSFAPLVVQVDVTGSMGEWPKIMFSKLPYLDLEGKEYLGADMEISFAAVGDATCDTYPVQVQPFGSGTALKDNLTKLVIEGGGGGGGTESYELGALFYARNVEMPNAIRPIFIFVADEMPYTRVSKHLAAKAAKVALSEDLTVDQVFAELKEKYAVYLVHKPYSDPATRQEWVRLIGEDHIADLADPERVVDVIFGILAREKGRLDYFRKEIEGRQKKHQVDTVYKALKTIHAGGAVAVRGPGKSTLHTPTGGKPAKGLL